MEIFFDLFINPILGNKKENPENLENPTKNNSNEIKKDVNYYSYLEERKVILVTGGAGFLGRNLCKRLIESNENCVVCLDNLITGSKKNVDDFIQKRKLCFY